jgi:hypothetical protein
MPGAGSSRRTVWAKIGSNPVVYHLIQRGRWPRPHATRQFFIYFGIGGLALSVICVLIDEIFFYDEICYGVLGGLLVIGAIVIYLGPLLTALLTAIFVARHVRTDLFELMRVTTLPGKAIRSGYVLASIYRFRFLLAIGFGLMWMRIVIFTYTYEEDSLLINVLAGLGGTLMTLLIRIILHGVAILFAVWSGLWWRRVGAAIFSTYVLMFVFLLAVIGVVLLLSEGGGEWFAWWRFLAAPVVAGGAFLGFRWVRRRAIREL